MSVLPCPHRRPRSPAEEQVTVPKLHAPNLGVRRWADTSLHGARHTPGPGGQQGCRAGRVRPRLALAGAPGPGRSRPRFGEEGWGANPGPWCSREEAVVCNGRLTPGWRLIMAPVSPTGRIGTQSPTTKIHPDRESLAILTVLKALTGLK